MQLSERLSLVAGFVTEGYRLADIGTDHGYIPIELVKKGTVPSAIAMDINSGPLDRAYENVQINGLSGKIETRLSDGLCNLNPGEADSVVIAGTGGALTVKILEEGKNVLNSVKEIILSPHTEIFLVRKYLIDNMYEIVREEMVCDMGKFYTVMRAVHTKDKSIKGEYEKDKNSYIYGKLLLEEKSPVFLEYLSYESRKQADILKNMENATGKNKKKEEIKEKIDYIENILHPEG